jgi:hypothetical protein
MGGIDWAAMPVVVELYNVKDIPLFIQKLEAVRDHIRMIEEAGHGK